jgi:hypothetical protein
MIISEGDFVKFKKGLYADERDTVYRVIEINGDRTILELANTKMPIPPQSVAKLTDLEKLVEYPDRGINP